MGFKAYLAGILTGAICTLAGYLISHADRVASADAGANSGNGFSIVAPSSGANERLIYVLDSTDPAKPRMSVYAVESGKELQLRAHRTCEFDKLFDEYVMGGKADSPQDLKERHDKLKPK